MAAISEHYKKIINKMYIGPPLIGVSHSIERIRELIKHVTDTGLNILITGESGVGKEVVANSLYYSSARRGKPFVKINCAALPEGLLESELFGYERGAFTGAERKRRGKFELAHEGVLFLDEIGDMSLPLQSKLLHVLQSGEFAPLGSEKEIKTDAWVIAATNQELEQRIKEGKFREDLYYRLNIIKIYIPPLRSRPEDIPPLIEYYIEAYNAQFNTSQLSKPNKQIMEKLMAYHWPGNIRELQNILRRLIVIYSWDEIIDELSINKSSMATNINTAEPLSNKTSITADLLDLKGENSPDNSSFSLKKIRKKTLDIVEKEVISNVLNQTGWNRTKAAKILKISYKTLLYKITDLNITPQHNSNR